MSKPNTEKCQGVAAPRPQTLRSQLGRVVQALEIPDCRCPYRVRITVIDVPGTPGKPAHTFKWPCLLPCPHVESSDHDLSIEEWTRLLLLFNREGYADRPAPAAPWGIDKKMADAAESLYREARVALYMTRARNGVGLYHPKDWHMGDVEGEAVQACKRRKEGTMIHELSHAIDEDEDAHALEALADLWASVRQGKGDGNVREEKPGRPAGRRAA